MHSVRIDEQLAEMRSYISRNDWDGLEKNARKRAEKLAGKEAAAKVADIDLGDYVEQLEDALKEAFEAAEEQEAAAIFFEYDMEHDWSSTLHICQEYNPEDEEDDDWSKEADEELDGPECPELAALYESDFDSDDEERAVNGYLIARTVAAVGRCIEEMPDSDFAVCVGFPDQDLLTRIRETEGRAISDDDDEDDEDDDE